MAKMSKAQYLLLAEALNEASKIYIPSADAFPPDTKENLAYSRGKKVGVQVAIEFIADALAKDNQAFNRSHFVDMANGRIAIAAPKRNRRYAALENHAKRVYETDRDIPGEFSDEGEKED